MAHFKGKSCKMIAAWNISGNSDGNLINEDAELEELDILDPRYGRFNPEVYKDDNWQSFAFNYGKVPL